MWGPALAGRPVPVPDPECELALHVRWKTKAGSHYPVLPSAEPVGLPRPPGPSGTQLSLEASTGGQETSQHDPGPRQAAAVAGCSGFCVPLSKHRERTLEWAHTQGHIEKTGGSLTPGPRVPGGREACLVHSTGPASSLSTGGRCRKVPEVAHVNQVRGNCPQAEFLHVPLCAVDSGVLRGITEVPRAHRLPGSRPLPPRASPRWLRVQLTQESTARHTDISQQESRPGRFEKLVCQA